MPNIHGIHHITAIASNPQQTFDFYTKILGLRLVKKSVNQDDTKTYHLFFGNKTGDPGMDLTFFTFQPIIPGQRGTGQVTTISLAVPENALDFWQERFKKHNVTHEEISEYFGKKRLIFYDKDNQRLELVGEEERTLAANDSEVWTTAEISENEAIRYFYSARLTVGGLALIEPVLTHIFGYEQTGSEEHTTLFKLPGKDRAAFLEVEESPLLEPGITANGTVHHIAFEVADEESELQLRQEILNLGLFPTGVIDRYYFKSVYFRTPAGILFELATSGPGFTVDEEEAHLGEKLALPPFLEEKREEIEAGLEPIE